MLPGPNAQPEVRLAVRRYLRIPWFDRIKPPLLYWLLGDGTPPFKLTKAETRYTDASPVVGQYCANCVSAYQNVPTSVYICDQVRGVIQPPGWCDRWRPPLPRATYIAYQER